MQKKAAFLICMVLCLLFVSCKKQQDPKTEAASPNKEATLTYIVPEYRTKGNKAAPIVITMFSETQCSACRAAAPKFKELVTKLGDKVFVEYMHLVFPQHKWSLYGSVALECAGRQGKFFEYYETLFAKQPDWSSSNALPYSQFVDYANINGLNIQNFRTCFSDEKILDEILTSVFVSGQNGIDEAPSYMVNGVTVTGFTALQEKVEELQKSQPVKK